MERRELGTSGLEVSAIGLGCMGMSQSYGTGDDDESIRTILRAIDLGLTLLDTLEKNCALVNQLETFARSKGCSPPQLALAWLLAKGRDLVPIPGTKRRRNVEENIAAVDIALTPADVAALDEAFPIGTAAGARYPPDGMRLLETERAGSC
jgi:aryl-alcohol dehydrogenase-like predicted oxidoreductase